MAKTENGEWLNGNVSTFPAYSPGCSTRAYGGHVFAQSALAASRTVKPGFVIHSITGWFTIQASTTKPFNYRVCTVREGNGYCQRQIDAWQDAAEGPCFTAIASFKKPEPSLNAQQQRIDLRQKYRCVLGSKRPEDFPECPTVDSPHFWAVEADRGKDAFPGLKMTKVDMAAYNGGRPPLQKRQLHWYKILGPMPCPAADPNVHVAAHLYASDRNGLFPVPNFVGAGDDYSAIASLSHTVVFHVEVGALALVDGRGGEDVWFCQEMRLESVAHGRALMTSRCWREDGVHVFSHFQDGQLRFSRKEGTRTARDIFGSGVSLAEPAKGKEKL